MRLTEESTGEAMWQLGHSSVEISGLLKKGRHVTGTKPSVAVKMKLPHLKEWVVVVLLITLCPKALSQTFPLQVSPNGRYLVGQDGTPWFMSGNTGWGLLTHVSVADADTFLTRCKDNGINLVMTWLIATISDEHSPANLYNVPPFTGPSFATPNEPYFAHVDSILTRANELGICILLFPAYLGYQCDGSEGWCPLVQSSSTATMKSWGQYLGQRYGAYPNIVWALSGDANPSSVMTKLDSMMAGIRQYSTQHLGTSHNGRGTLATDYWDSRPWLTLNGYEITVDTVYGWAKKAYNHVPRLPFHLTEGWYEYEHGMTSQQIRSQIYWTVLGGGTGHIFGNCPLDCLGYSLWGCGTNWLAEFSGQGIRSVKNANSMMLSRHWHTLIPDWDHTVVTSGYGIWGSTNYATVAYASDSSSIVGYLPTRRTITINPSVLKGDSIHVWWYNPADGNVTDGGLLSKATRSYRQPSTADWVLVIDSKSFNFNSPGNLGPTLLSPQNGITGVATNPTLMWNASPGATSYRVQVSTSVTFATTIIDQSNIAGTSYAASGLSAGTTYYWHVGATNSGGTSTYSAVWNFTTVALPPAPPILATPANGATGVATNLTLTWNASTGATSYRVQVSTDTLFATTVVDQNNIAANSYAISGLNEGTKYYWHVNASNTGGTSAYSPTWNFTTVIPPPPPATPVLATPANGAPGVTTNLTLTWNASAGAASYRVQVSTDTAFATTVINQGNLATTSYAISGLNEGTRYYWHVNATNTGGTSPYALTWNFTTVAPPPPPQPPVLATPANGVAGVATNPTLTWNASAGAASYRVQVSTDPAFASTLLDQSNLMTTSYAMSGLAANTQYYWHVNASNSGGTSDYTTAWNFTTVGVPLGLIAAYAFDEGAGSTVTDASGNGLTGTLAGASWTAEGMYGDALSFAGNDYVELGNPSEMQVKGSMTWSAWVKPTANPSSGEGMIVSKSSSRYGWQLKTIITSGQQRFSVAVSSSSRSRTVRYSSTTVSLNTWYHVAGVYNATARTLTIYVNGVSSNGTLSGGVPSSQYIGKVNVNIGRRWGGDYFNGIIDEVRVYSRALTQSEIQADMNTPIGSPVAGPSITGIEIKPSSMSIDITWNEEKSERVAAVHVVANGQDPPASNTSADHTATLTVSAHEAGSLSYQWQNNGVDIPDATGPLYTPAIVNPSDVKTIRCVVSNSRGSDTTAEIILSARAPSVRISQTIDMNTPLPVEYSLAQNYPNPFNPRTTIEYALPYTSHVVLSLFNVVGREVATLVNDVQNAGYRSVEWNAEGFASGVYFYRLQAGDFVQTRKLLLLR